MRPFNYSRSCVGVDINENEIRLMHLKKQKQQWIVINFAVAPLPKDAILDGRIKHFESVQKTLKQLVTKTQTKCLPAVIAIPFTHVITKKIKLDSHIEESEYWDEISTHLSTYLPGMSEEMCFDFVKLQSDRVEHTELLLVACREELLNLYSAVVKEAGLTLRIIDIDLYALIRSVMAALPAEIQFPFCIVHIEKAMTYIVVLAKNAILFQQQWPTIEEDQLFFYIHRALQLCLSTHLTLQINRILIVGMTSKPASFFENFSIPTIVFDPLAIYFSKSSKKREALMRDSSRLIVSCGLAMRKLKIW